MLKKMLTDRVLPVGFVLMLLGYVGQLTALFWAEYHSAFCGSLL